MEPQKNKKRKLIEKGNVSSRPFQDIWTEIYGVVDRNNRSLCLLCNETVVSRTWNVKRHFETNHSHLLNKSIDERKEYISRQLELYKNQTNSNCKFVKSSTNFTSASYSIAHSIAQNGKPISDGEFLKQTFLKCAPTLFHDMKNKDEIIKRISELPVSKNIIKDRIIDLNKNVQDQLKKDLTSCKYFSISLDETTDVKSNTELAIIARYSDGVRMREELIKLESVPVGKSGSEICNVVTKTFNDLNIDISKIVSVTTDGAPNMVGKNMGFIKIFVETIGHPVVPFHCIIHEKVLYTKSGFSELNDIVLVVTKVVNFIAAWPHRKPEFSELLLEVESSYNGQLMLSNVRWLSQGKVLERFVECLDEIVLFIENKDLINIPQVIDHIWLSKLMFFTDLCIHINELKLKLQGLGKSIEVVFEYIKSFESKLQIFKRDVVNKTYTYFPHLKKYFEKATKPCEMESLLLYQNIINTLIQQFSERFNQFRSLEQTIKIIMYPDVVCYNTLELKDFQWMQIDDLEMQLVDFQNSIWAHGFVQLRSTIEYMEQNQLNNENEYNYEDEILKLWNRVPDTYSSLKNLAMALLTIFTSTYFCETLFSALNNIKANKWNELTEVSGACLALKCTKYKPEIEELASRVQHQKSY